MAEAFAAVDCSTTQPTRAERRRGRMCRGRSRPPASSRPRWCGRRVADVRARFRRCCSRRSVDRQRTASSSLTPIAGATRGVARVRLHAAARRNRAGLAAAVLVATIPIVLFQVVQPMNDIAIGGAVDGGARRGDHERPGAPAGSSACSTGLAVLVRPNLAPRPSSSPVWLTMMQRAGRWSTPSGWLRREPAAGFAVGSAPAAALL